MTGSADGEIAIIAGVPNARIRQAIMMRRGIRSEMTMDKDTERQFRDLCLEAKARVDGFRELYGWLDQRDVDVSGC